jgi:hypothetical protein
MMPQWGLLAVSRWTVVGVRMAVRPLEVCRLAAGIVAAVRVRSLLAGAQGLKAEDSRGRRPGRPAGVGPAGRCWSLPDPGHAWQVGTDRAYVRGTLDVKSPIRACRGDSRPKATLRVEHGTEEAAGLARRLFPRPERILVNESSGFQQWDGGMRVGAWPGRLVLALPDRRHAASY